MIRFCQDCNQERSDTTWSDRFGTRLCVECFNIKCAAIDDRIRDQHEAEVARAEQWSMDANHVDGFDRDDLGESPDF